MTRKNVFTILAIVTISAFSLMYSCTKDEHGGHHHFKLIAKTNQEALEDCLTVQVMDKSFQWDGKVMVTYTNTCENYEFKLKRTGLKYSSGKKIEYLIRDTPIFISAGSTVTLEISIPFGIKPKVAYALADDAKAIHLK